MDIKEETFWEKHGTKFKVTLGFVAGGVVMYFVGRNSSTLINSFQQNNIALFGGKNVVTTDLVRRGHPGFIVKDVESGVVAASKRHMMDILEVSHKSLDQMIENGIVEVIGEAH